MAGPSPGVAAGRGRLNAYGLADSGQTTRRAPAAAAWRVSRTRSVTMRGPDPGVHLTPCGTFPGLAATGTAPALPSAGRRGRARTPPAWAAATPRSSAAPARRAAGAFLPPGRRRATPALHAMTRNDTA